jgi:polygalacturonase
MTCKKYLLILIILLYSTLSSQSYKPLSYNIREYGAVGDGKTYDTESIQRAIDKAYENGGGTIYFPAGTYLTRTIILRDNITLALSNGCKILGSTDLNIFNPEYGSFQDSDGRKFGIALIFAKDCKNISIEGNGTIDGQGFKEFYPRTEGVSRPYLIRFIRCSNIKVKGITLTNSAAWVQHYFECDDMTIDGITVRSYSNVNNDGLDIEGCHRVIVTRCNIDCEDDSIVLKALSTRACRDIVISDCIISGLKSAIKTGTESVGNFENITISNCTIYGTRGISLLTVDGGSISNVTISNISLRNSYAVIVMRLGARMNKYSVSDSLLPKKPGTIKNIMINNIQASGVTESNDFISGIPDNYIENVSLSNIRIEYTGGGTTYDFKRTIPELVNDYPKAKMFENLPSYGFFIRHAKNLTIKDLEICYKINEERPAIYCNDVIGFHLSGLKAKSPYGKSPLIFMNDVQDVIISSCTPIGSPVIFVQLSGSNTREIIFNRNFLGSETELYSANSEVNVNTIKELK